MIVNAIMKIKLNRSNKKKSHHIRMSKIIQRYILLHFLYSNKSETRTNYTRHKSEGKYLNWFFKIPNVYKSLNLNLKATVSVQTCTYT